MYACVWWRPAVFECLSLPLSLCVGTLQWLKCWQNRKLCTNQLKICIYYYYYLDPNTAPSSSHLISECECRIMRAQHISRQRRDRDARRHAPTDRQSGKTLFPPAIASARSQPPTKRFAFTSDAGRHGCGAVNTGHCSRSARLCAIRASQNSTHIEQKCAT